MESVRSSRRHGRRGGKFVFKIRKRLCGLCLIGKIVPKHCTTALHHCIASHHCASENLCMALEALDQSRYS